ncbi:hypothetical protein FB446DRAFT_795244 [Lentinula raphanica]|nr:hypothetical protein FB446DRAFT_795244 [Lentinula raphanica]
MSVYVKAGESAAGKFPQPLPPPEIQQVPLHLKNIFSGIRTQVYDIIRTPHFEDGSKGTQIPTSVKVKGVPGATGTPVEHVVLVAQLLRPLTPANGDENSSSVLGQRFLHVLAAKSLLTCFCRYEDAKQRGTERGASQARNHPTGSLTTTPTPTEGEAASVIPVSGFSESRIAVQSRRVGSGKAPRMQLASTEEGSRCNDSGADKKAGLSRARIASQTHARPRPAAFVAQQTCPSSSSTLMDVDQNPFEDTRPTKRAKGSSFSACLASTSTPSLPATLTIAECLTTVAHLQNSTASSLRHKPSSDC